MKLQPNLWAAFALVVIALIPQIVLIAQRGKDWNGSYATLQGDEFLYSAYIKSLSNGQPLKTDPFSARKVESQTTFSIQFLPALVLSRLNVSASITFILLTIASSALAVFSVTWLLSLIIPKYSAASAIFVLCCGTIIVGQGVGPILLGRQSEFLGLLFLRRYQPSAAFFVFFLFCGFIWKLLTSHHVKYVWLSALTFGVLVFSYIYLWTAALIWAICIIALWAYFRDIKWKRIALLAILTALPLIPYLYLITQRHSELDQAQTLIATRTPDLFRGVEIIGMLIIVFLLWFRRQSTRDVAAASFALMPLIVFNQQIVTGKTLQPYHYELFIANYSVLISIVILLSTLRWDRLLVRLVPLCLLLGALEMALPAMAGNHAEEDRMVPAFKVLHDQPQGVVFSPDIRVMRMLPTWANQGTLLDIGGVDFGFITRKERKELLFAYLYYSNIPTLNDALATKTFLGQYVASTLFGKERTVSVISGRTSVSAIDIETASQEYARYVQEFNPQSAPTIHYVIAEQAADLSRINQWYKLQPIQIVEGITIYLVVRPHRLQIVESRG